MIDVLNNRTRDAKNSTFQVHLISPIHLPIVPRICHNIGIYFPKKLLYNKQTVGSMTLVLKWDRIPSLPSKCTYFWLLFCNCFLFIKFYSKITLILCIELILLRCQSHTLYFNLKMLILKFTVVFKNDLMFIADQNIFTNFPLANVRKSA